MNLVSRSAFLEVSTIDVRRPLI